MPNVMAAQPNTDDALCESSVIPFLVPHHKVWLTTAAPAPCSIAANIGERNTWTQSKFCTWQNQWHHRTYKLGVKIRKFCSLNCLWTLSRPIEKQRCLCMCAVYVLRSHSGMATFALILSAAFHCSDWNTNKTVYRTISGVWWVGACASDSLILRALRHSRPAADNKAISTLRTSHCGSLCVFTVHWITLYITAQLQKLLSSSSRTRILAINLQLLPLTLIGPHTDVHSLVNALW